VLGKWEDFKVGEKKERFSIGKSGRVRKEGRVKSGKREGVSGKRGMIRRGKGRKRGMVRGRSKCWETLLTIPTFHTLNPSPFSHLQH
jgi:hypothetical protein